MSKKYKVIVCGTLFGQVYLSAFKQKCPEFKLVGIVARGSQRSQSVAKNFGVPLYKNLDNLPEDIDIACVVVGSTITGRAGSKLATSLLEKGIHVIQEHPVYETEVAECLRLAKQYNCQYLVNTHYPTVPAAQHFIDYSQAAIQNQSALFVEVTCGVQVVCGMLDILSRALGKIAPFEFYASPSLPQATINKAEFKPPYRVIQGLFAGIPIIIKLQNQLDSNNPDNHFHIMHRMTIGFPSGNLMLVNTHGPVLWSRQFHVPRKTEKNGEKNIATEKSVRHYFEPPLSEVIFSGEACLEDVLNEHWSRSVRLTLRQLRAIIASPSPKIAQQLLARAKVWRALMSCVGNPESISAKAPVKTTPDIQQWLSTYQGQDNA